MGKLAQTNPGRGGGIMTTYLSKKNSTVRFQRTRERAFELFIANAEHLPGLIAALVFGLSVVGLMFGMAE